MVPYLLEVRRESEPLWEARFDRPVTFYEHDYLLGAHTGGSMAWGGRGCVRPACVRNDARLAAEPRGTIRIGDIVP